MRSFQIVCGVALIPVSAWLAWRATDDAPAAALLAFLLAGAPFLVMWSRWARPYAITLLLCLICIAAVWRWREERSRKMATYAAVTAALLAWFHPISGIYPVIACIFVFFEDTFAPSEIRPRPSSSSLRLGATVAAAMALPIAVPLYHDRQSLAAKAGGDRPDFDGFERMFSIIWGGVPNVVVVVACLFAMWGTVVIFRRNSWFALYLLALMTIPGANLFLVGAIWMQSGQNFLRYQLPLEPLVLFFGSVGVISAARSVVRWRAEAIAWSIAALISIGYLVASPTIVQVVTLGQWYGSPHYHWDYRYRWMIAKRNDPATPPLPAFYNRLARMAPGSAPIIEAPFVWEGFIDEYAYYAIFHRQPETFGMIHDLCLKGERYGEVPPHDRRFRFRSFVFLNDKQAVLGSGSRYLLLHRRPPPTVGPEYNYQLCLAKIAELYGAPVEIDDRLAVFDLRPWEKSPEMR